MKSNKLAWRKIRLSLFIGGSLLVAAIFLLAGCTGPEGPAGVVGPQGPVGPQGAAGAPGAQGAAGAAGAPGAQGAAGAIGPQGATGPAGEPGFVQADGLVAKITAVTIGADRKPVVTFAITDEKGQPLKITDLDPLAIPGAMPARFTIAYLTTNITTNLTAWVNLVMAPGQGQPFTFNGTTRQPAIANGTQPNILMDMGGSYRDLGKGSFTYTFATVLPENYDRNATFRVGGEATRTVAGKRNVTNATFDFVPGGGALRTRQVVAVESCNQCHDPLALHGGLRQDPKLCVVCHTSQNVDLETGNTLELKNMVHKIHRGARLPSVLNGTPYILKGFPAAPVDFSKAVWPQFGQGIGDVRTCTTCHGEPPVGMTAADYAKLAPNADNYKLNPSRAACGACHDQIDWTTGKSTIAGRRDHPEGAQADDSKCPVCHEADKGREFDASVVGAHTIPAYSKQLKGINVAIVSVTNTAPGQNPTVVFTAKDNAGNALVLSQITSLAFNLKSPTTDYQGLPLNEAANLSRVVANTDGSFSYTLTTVISINATGSGAIQMEARRLETIKRTYDGVSLNVTGASYNPVAYFPITDKVVVPRRQIVATEKCNVCHKRIVFHGGGRLNPAEGCILCHNPSNVDVPQNVPARFGGPFLNIIPQSINFKFMIHRIHTGEELTRDFTIYRAIGVFNFNEVRFPGDRRNCAKCHVGNSYLLPLPETNANTVAPRELYSPLGPAAAACLGCHDSKPAVAHAGLMTATIGETCAVCHGQGKEFAVEKVHAR